MSYHEGNWYRQAGAREQRVKDVMKEFRLVDTGVGVLNGGLTWFVYGEPDRFYRFNEGDETAWRVYWQSDRSD